MIQNDVVAVGLLLSILALIFYVASIPNAGIQKFFKIVPTLLLCYFLPSLLTSTGLVSSEMAGKLYTVAKNYFLPASLVLLTLSIDLKEVLKLGPKAIIMFLTAVVGVILGGPIAILIMEWIDPTVIEGDVWRGMTTIAGSWIGGGANQAAMYEVFKPQGEEAMMNFEKLYSVMITVDVVVAEIWMAFLLLGVGKRKSIDAWLKADNSAVDSLTEKMKHFAKKTARVSSFNDLLMILGIGIGLTGLAHFLADTIAPFLLEHAPQLKKFSLTSKFFWLIVLATTFGIVASFTKARNYEGAGASKVGSVFIYFLVATIGLKMDVREIFHNGMMLVVGLIWMAFHVLLMFVVAKWVKAPYFFIAVGSKASIGGAASAPVVAAAFHPALAPVGVLLAVLGYALGTYGAWICGMLMQAASMG